MNRTIGYLYHRLNSSVSQSPGYPRPSLSRCSSYPQQSANRLHQSILRCAALLLQDVHRSIAKFFKANLVDTATRVRVASGHTDAVPGIRIGMLWPVEDRTVVRCAGHVTRYKSVQMCLNTAANP